MLLRAHLRILRVLRGKWNHKPLMAHLVRTGQIRAVKLGKRVVVSVQSLREFIDGRKAPDNSPENCPELQGDKSNNPPSPRLLSPDVPVTSSG